nr:hypothetical protein [Tanacetum cinerariifolium]
MLERGSYIPWKSRFRRYLNRKRENKKWLNKAIDECPYEFKDFTPSDSEPPRPQTEDDFIGDDLKHYKAEIEAMNLILISIPNNIYNSVDACTTAQAMWQRVERLMRGTVQNKVDKETRFSNEFDLFVAEPAEALVLTEDTYDDFFDYLYQYETLKLLAKQDEEGVTVADEQNDFLVAYATRMEEIEKLSTNICLMARIQPTNIDSAFLSEIQTPSTSSCNNQQFLEL